MDNLVISEETAISPSDVFLDGQTITEVDLDTQCQGVIGRLHETGDRSEIEATIKNLNGLEKVASRVKAKLIYEYSVWFKDSGQGEDFATWYISEHGGDTLTVKKHQAVGELLLDADVPDGVKQLPHKELISVARAKQSGYDLEDYWDEIALAGSESDVNEIVRRAKGKEKRKGSLDIVFHSDGSIVGWLDSEWVSLGWLNVADRDDEKTSDVKRKILETGISRIVHNTGMRTK